MRCTCPSLEATCPACRAYATPAQAEETWQDPETGRIYRTPQTWRELTLHAERLGMTPLGLQRRLKRWPLAKALSTPPLHGGGRWSKMARAIEAYLAQHPEEDEEARCS